MFSQRDVHTFAAIRITADAPPLHFLPIFGTITTNLNYRRYRNKLLESVELDQTDKKKLGRYFFERQLSKTHLERYETFRRLVRLRSHDRSRLVMRILDIVSANEIYMLKDDGVRALAAIAIHGDRETLTRATSALVQAFKRSVEPIPIDVIPSMIDYSRVLDQKRQLYGTIWLFDDAGSPYFYPADADDETVNKRRREFGIGQIRWPKSMAIAEDKQPWLKMPIVSRITRFPTPLEYEDILFDHVTANANLKAA